MTTSFTLAAWEQNWIHGPNIPNPNARCYVLDDGVWIPIDDEEETIESEEN